MKRALLIVSSVLLTIQLHANQIYGWVGKPGEGENYFILKSNSSASGTLADIVSLTLMMPYTGETTYLPASFTSLNMTLGPGFSWTPAEITGMVLTFSTPSAPCSAGYYSCYPTLSAAGLSVDYQVSNGINGWSGSYVDDATGRWLAFATLADYQAALSALGTSVPDCGNSALLLLGTLAGLVLCRRALAV